MPTNHPKTKGTKQHSHSTYVLTKSRHEFRPFGSFLINQFSLQQGNDFVTIFERNEQIRIHLFSLLVPFLNTYHHILMNPFRY